MPAQTILAIETSCDETAVAILRGNELLVSEVASQTEHEAYGGVVPEVASRNHLLHAPRLLESAVQKAALGLHEVDAFAATVGPGLASSLMIGASIAKGLALGFSKPYLAINHLEGHLLSPFSAGDFAVEPNVSLIVSGGHTLLVEVRALNKYRILGRTADDADRTRGAGWHHDREPFDSEDGKGTRDPLLDTRRHLFRADLPARRYPGVPSRHPGRRASDGE